MDLSWTENFLIEAFITTNYTTVAQQEIKKKLKTSLRFVSFAISRDGLYFYGPREKGRPRPFRQRSLPGSFVNSIRNSKANTRLYAMYTMLCTHCANHGTERPADGHPGSRPFNVSQKNGFNANNKHLKFLFTPPWPKVVFSFSTPTPQEERNHCEGEVKISQHWAQLWTGKCGKLARELCLVGGRRAEIYVLVFPGFCTEMKSHSGGCLCVPLARHPLDDDRLTWES